MAELATVVGHEIGHVTARHSVSQISKAQLAQLGLSVGSILAPEQAQQFGGLAETGLGLLFLKERLTVTRSAALVLGIVGLIVVLGSEQGYPVPRNPGDWLALLSGVFWAYGSLRIFRAPQIAVHEQSVAFVGGGLLISLIVALLPAGLIGPAPSLAAASQAAVPLILIVIFMLLPIIYLTLIGARVLSPGRVGILLMGEVVVGVASAAILTDEPFGLREVLGTLLILSAAGTEVVKRQPPLSAT